MYEEETRNLNEFLARTLDNAGRKLQGNIGLG
jgi:hypothetical protein